MADYGFEKLIDLFEAIPKIVDFSEVLEILGEYYLASGRGVIMRNLSKTDFFLRSLPWFLNSVGKSLTYLILIRNMFFLVKPYWTYFADTYVLQDSDGEKLIELTYNARLKVGIFIRSVQYTYVFLALYVGC